MSALSLSPSTVFFLWLLLVPTLSVSTFLSDLFSLTLLQVKKMLGACGGAVAALHRERIGGLVLADYPELAEELKLA